MDDGRFRLTGADLKRYIDQTLGYGDFKSSVWFVGLEEGGARDAESAFRQVLTRVKRGAQALEDLPSFRDALGLGPPETQPNAVWGWLARFALGFEAEDSGRSAPISPEFVTRFLRDRLGRRGSRTCLLEFLPLPAPSLGQFSFSVFSGELPWIGTKPKYRKYCFEQLQRVETLQGCVRQHEPKVVMFYGSTCRDPADAMAGGKLMPLSEEPRMLVRRDGATLFVRTPFPKYHQKVTPDFFEWAGRQSARLRRLA